MKERSGEGTLIASIVMSSPGPLVVGLGLFLGNSNIQVADFIRRIAELGAIVISWLVFRALRDADTTDPSRKNRLDRIARVTVGAVMCLSGGLMLLMVLLVRNSEKGNIIPGLVIAILGVTANSIFWLRYRFLNRLKTNSVMSAQAGLYLAKALVDACVVATLLTLALVPTSPVTALVDTIGSIIVAVYLVLAGLKTLLAFKAKESEVLR